MIKLDLDKKFQSPSEEEVKGIMATLVANKLFSLTKVQNPVKLYDLALRLFKEKSITLDDSDFQMIKVYVEKDESWPIFLQAQILKEFNEAKESSQK